MQSVAPGTQYPHAPLQSGCWWGGKPLSCLERLECASRFRLGQALSQPHSIPEWNLTSGLKLLWVRCQIRHLQNFLLKKYILCLYLSTVSFSVAPERATAVLKIWKHMESHILPLLSPWKKKKSNLQCVKGSYCLFLLVSDLLKIQLKIISFFCD